MQTNDSSKDVADKAKRENVSGQFKRGCWLCVFSFFFIFHFFILFIYLFSGAGHDLQPERIILQKAGVVNKRKNNSICRASRSVYTLEVLNVIISGKYKQIPKLCPFDKVWPLYIPQPSCCSQSYPPILGVINEKKSIKTRLMGKKQSNRLLSATRYSFIQRK